MKNIVFDLGRVLLSYEPLEYLKKYYKNYKELNEIIFKNPLWLKLDEGTLTKDEFIQIVTKRYPEYTKEIIKIMDNWIELLTPIKDNIDLLPILKDKGYDLYVISNFHKDAYDRYLKNESWTDLFDGMIISANEKIMKPDLKIFDLFLNRYHLNSDETLFIDDSMPNIEACEKIGIHGLYLSNSSLLKTKLEEMHII